MHPGDGLIRLLNFDGTVAATLDAPGSGMMCRGWATPVRFGNGQAPYFAAVVWWMKEDRSVLFIYSAEQNLVYREVIGERCGSIAAVPGDDDGSQKLLVGGTGTVWAYTPEGDR